MENHLDAIANLAEKHATETKFVASLGEDFQTVESKKKKPTKETKVKTQSKISEEKKSYSDVLNEKLTYGEYISQSIKWTINDREIKGPKYGKMILDAEIGQYLIDRKVKVTGVIVLGLRQAYYLLTDEHVKVRSNCLWCNECLLAKSNVIRVVNTGFYLHVNCWDQANEYILKEQSLHGGIVIKPHICATEMPYVPTKNSAPSVLSQGEKKNISSSEEDTDDENISRAVSMASKFDDPISKQSTIEKPIIRSKLQFRSTQRKIFEEEKVHMDQSKLIDVDALLAGHGKSEWSHDQLNQELTEAKNEILRLKEYSAEMCENYERVRESFCKAEMNVVKLTKAYKELNFNYEVEKTKKANLTIDDALNLIISHLGDMSNQEIVKCLKLSEQVIGLVRTELSG